MKPEKINLRGTTFIFISSFFYATYGVWARLMSSGFGEFSQAWTRGLILLTVILAINHFTRFFKKIAKKDLPWFIIIALCGGLNQAPYFLGFKYLDIGTATLLIYASLLAGGYLIGKIVFKEKFTKVKYLSLFLAVVGMFTIYKFSLPKNQLFAVGFPIAAGLMGAIASVLPKKLSSQYPELQIMSGYFLVMIIANGVIAILLQDPLPEKFYSIAWIGQIGYCLAMLFANWTVIEGFKTTKASIGSLIGLFEILFGIMFGVLFFKESITFGTVIGGSLIILSASLPSIDFKPGLKSRLQTGKIQ